MYIQWGFLPDSKSLLISHTEPTPPDKSQRQGLTSSREFLKVAVSTATAVYLVSSEGLSHRTCRGRCRHNTSPGALWRPRSCSACCLISTVQLLSYWPFYSKFLLWFLLCSWKEMAEKSEGCGFHQIGSEGFSNGVCKRHIYYMLSETIYDHWELWSTRKVSIWNALAFLLKLNSRESVSMSERVSCSSNTREAKVRITWGTCLSTSSRSKMVSGTHQRSKKPGLQMPQPALEVSLYKTRGQTSSWSNALFRKGFKVTFI